MKACAVSGRSYPPGADDARLAVVAAGLLLDSWGVAVAVFRGAVAALEGLFFVGHSGGLFRI